jgi:hypothetical protein
LVERGVRNAEASGSIPLTSIFDGRIRAGNRSKT